MICFEHVDKFVLSDLNVYIPKGTIVGVVGASGVGKTTMLKLVCGLLAPESGRVWTFGRDPLERRREISKRLYVYLADKPYFEQEDTVIGQFRMLKSIYRWEDAVYDSTYKMLSEELGFAAYEGKQVKQLSLGERRRVELSVMLFGNPELLILDEPTIGLDEKGKRIFWQKLQQKKAEGAAILISSHNMAEIEQLCDRIVLLGRQDGDRNSHMLFYGDKDLLLRKFAPINEMEIYFEGPIPDMEDLPLIRYGIRQDNLTLQYNSNHISASEIMKTLLAQTTIVQANIIRPDLSKAIQVQGGKKDGVSD